MPASDFGNIVATNGVPIVNVEDRQFRGSLRREIYNYTAAGAIQAGRGLLAIISNGSAIAMTLAAPSGGEDIVIYNAGAGAATVTLPSGVTWDGTNDVVTIESGEALHAVAVSATRWLVLAAVGTLAYS